VFPFDFVFWFFCFLFTISYGRCAGFFVPKPESDIPARIVVYTHTRYASYRCRFCPTLGLIACSRCRTITGHSIIVACRRTLLLSCCVRGVVADAVLVKGNEGNDRPTRSTLHFSTGSSWTVQRGSGVSASSDSHCSFQRSYTSVRKPNIENNIVIIDNVGRYTNHERHMTSARRLVRLQLRHDSNAVTCNCIRTTPPPLLLVPRVIIILFSVHERVVCVVFAKNTRPLWSTTTTKDAHGRRVLAVKNWLSPSRAGQPVYRSTVTRPADPSFGQDRSAQSRVRSTALNPKRNAFCR